MAYVRWMCFLHSWMLFVPSCSTSPDDCPAVAQGNMSFCWCLDDQIICSNLQSVPTITPDEHLYDTISMVNQNIDEIPDEAFSGLRVMNIILSGNPLGDRIRRWAFHGVNRYLQGLFLASCGLTTLPEHLLDGMYSLIHLNLADNNITHIPLEYFSHAQTLSNLDLSHNYIQHIAQNTFVGSEDLVTLDLSYNKITLDGFIFHPLVNLDILFLGFNYIDQIPDKLFMNQGRLRVLSLNNNLLQHLHNEMTYDLRDLEILYLNHNNIREISSNILLYMENLKVLSLRYNTIRDIASDAFAFGRSLRELDLSLNSLVRLPTGLLLNCFELKKLNMNGNYLHTLDECILPSEAQLLAVSLEDNPIECDCSMAWVKDVDRDSVMLSGTCRSGQDITDWTNYMDCPLTPNYDCYRQ